jgi:flagellar basal body P-ring formation protein FlgA
MISRPLLALLLALAPLSTAQAGSDLGAPTLRRSTVVTGEIVRVGDLVENAGRAEDVPIFRAPDLGTTGFVRTIKVLEALQAHDLIVVETSGIAEIEVTRMARAITPRDIEARVVRAFAGQYGLGDGKKLTITFDRDPRPLFVEPTATEELQVSRSSYDPRTGRFDVTFSIPGSAVAARTPLRYTGTLIETVEIATLSRPLGRGEIVKSSDVTIERRPKAEVMSDVLVRVDEVAGLSARQALRAGVPLRRNDLMKPEVVKRDETVTLIYEVPGILLTVRGKALETGSEGDVINVQNVQSKRTLQGTVTGPGRVTIAATTLSFTTAAGAANTPQQSE